MRFYLATQTKKYAPNVAFQNSCSLVTTSVRVHFFVIFYTLKANTKTLRIKTLNQIIYDLEEKDEQEDNYDTKRTFIKTYY